ncbi:galactose-binding domain-like protein, partial [Blyttiomyces helicus]
RVYYKDNIAGGVTLQNFYMTAGGTNWGHLAAPVVYTSYDYGSPITESRQLTTKLNENKLLGHLLLAVPDMAQTDAFVAQVANNAVLQVRARRNPTTGMEFRVFRNSIATISSTETFHAANVAGYAAIPQEPGTSISLQGRDSKLLLANLAFAGGHKLVYSTSEVMTIMTVGPREIIVLYAEAGQAGETVLAAGATATATSLLPNGPATSFSLDKNGIRLNYAHTSDTLQPILVKGAGTAGRDLLVLVVDRTVTTQLWPARAPGSDPTSPPDILVRGPQLVRSASVSPRGAVSMVADLAADTVVEVFAAGAKAILVNQVWATNVGFTAYGSIMGFIAGPGSAPTLPSLDRWKVVPATAEPEADLAFDDSNWQVCNKMQSNLIPAPTAGSPSLYADDYGFHVGHSTYRGHFNAIGTEEWLTLEAQGGAAFALLAWLNGDFLGSFVGTATASSTRSSFAIPKDSLHPNSDNVILVIVDNMGQEEGGGGPSNLGKSYRGLANAILWLAKSSSDAAPTIEWKINGNPGGEHLADTVRGPYNVGGLFGERAGYHLPGFPDDGWKDVGNSH